ncbi:MAG: segregation/condensation protein A [Propionibacteriaceae bacterium]|nr:segregation/condensation protein A [Propionibacteriaceae bacterium]
MSQVIESEVQGFTLTLKNFEGPFDLLLSLIARHKLDITEIALSHVTDEFIAFIKEQGANWDLDQVSSFLVVGATLLDLKTARLLPAGEVDNDEDLAILEARDLLFARLLQYRAFKQVAAWIESVLVNEAKRVPRPGGLEEKFAKLLPEAELRITGEELAQLAISAMTETAQAQVYVEHIYQPTVSVAEQANLVADRLQRSPGMTFRALVADSESLPTTVARFLAILELYRNDMVVFKQLRSNSDLIIRWVGPQIDDIEIEDEYDIPLETDSSGKES